MDESRAVSIPTSTADAPTPSERLERLAGRTVALPAQSEASLDTEDPAGLPDNRNTWDNRNIWRNIGR